MENNQQENCKNLQKCLDDCCRKSNSNCQQQILTKEEISFRILQNHFEYNETNNKCSLNKIKCQFKKNCANYIYEDNIQYICIRCKTIVVGCRDCYKKHICCQTIKCSEKAGLTKKYSAICDDCNKLYCKSCQPEHKKQNFCQKFNALETQTANFKSKQQQQQIVIPQEEEEVKQNNIQIIDEQNNQNVQQNSNKFKSFKVQLNNNEQLNILFPYNPYPEQKEFMQTLAQAVNKKKNSFLESPTGTGKTLSLLCTLLALQQSNQDFIIIYVSRTHTQVKQLIKELKKTVYKPKTTTLGSRDKFCLNKGVQESVTTNKTSLNFECKMACQNGECTYKNNLEENEENKNEKIYIKYDNQIRDIEELKEYGKQNQFCPYFLSWKNARKADIIFAPYAHILSLDIFKAIEEIAEAQHKRIVVVFDEAHNISQYTKSQNSLQVSDHLLNDCLEQIIKLKEYLQEISDCLEGGKKQSQKKYEIEMQYKNAKIESEKIHYIKLLKIIDNPNPNNKQAQTLENMKQKNIAKLAEILIKQTQNNLEKEKEKNNLQLSKFEIKEKQRRTKYQSVNKLKKKQRRLKQKQAENNSITEKYAKDYYLGSGPEIYKIIFGQKIKQQDIDKQIQNMLAVIELLQSKDFKVYCSDLENFHSFLETIYNYKDFLNSFVLTIHLEKKTPIDQQIKYNLINLDPSFVFKVLQEKDVNLIFTSGSLAPLPQLKKELKIKAQEQHLRSFSHIIDVDENVRAYRIYQGVCGSELNFKHQKRFNENQEEQDLLYKDTGYSLISIISDVPHGVVVFFLSYSFRNDCLRKWEEIQYQDSNLTIIEKINQLKNCFEEPVSQHSVNEEFKQYQKYAETEKGALFFAISRGKLAEGIDFTDELARAVIIIGVPNLNPNDMSTKLQMGYIADINNIIDWQNKKIQEQSIFQIFENFKQTEIYQQNQDYYYNSIKKAIKYYDVEVNRTTNQALGRCLRHKDDYGVIYLIDSRFGQRKYQEKLPKWIEKSVQNQSHKLTFKEIKKQTQEFFFEKKIQQKYICDVDRQQDYNISINEKLQNEDSYDYQLENKSFDFYLEVDEIEFLIQKGEKFHKGQIKQLKRGQKICFIESPQFSKDIILTQKYFNRALNQSHVYFSFMEPYLQFIKNLYYHIKHKILQLDTNQLNKFFYEAIQHKSFQNQQIDEQLISQIKQFFEPKFKELVKDNEYGGKEEQDQVFKKISLIFDQKASELLQQKNHQQYAKVVCIIDQPLLKKPILGYIDQDPHSNTFFYFPLDQYIPKMYLNMKMLNQKFKKQITEQSEFLTKQLFFAEYSYWDRNSEYPRVKNVEPSGIQRQDFKNQLYDSELLKIYSLDNSILLKIQSLKFYSKIYQEKLQSLKQYKNKKIQQVFTIDTDLAVTLDDCFSLEPYNDSQQFQYKLGIHISDPTTILDETLLQNATKRTCNIYLKFLDRISMIDNELCKLLSIDLNQERVAISAFFLINRKGEIKFLNFEQNIVKSQAALKYTEVDQFFQNQDKQKQNNNLSEIQENLLILQEFCHHKRKSMIYQDFQQDYEDIVLGEQYSEASKIVQILMIQANKNMSDHLFQNQEVRCQTIFRTNYHDPSQINVLKELLLEFLNIQFTDFEFKNLRSYVELGIKQNPIFKEIIKCRITQYISGRTGLKIGQQNISQLEQILYRHENLNFDNYCTYTSPIRKISDLINIIAFKQLQLLNQQEGYIQFEFKKDEIKQQLKSLDKEIEKKEKCLRMIENMSSVQKYCQELLLNEQKAIETEAIILNFDQNKMELIFPKFDKETQMLLPKFIFFKEHNLKLVFVDYGKNQQNNQEFFILEEIQQDLQSESESDNDQESVSGDEDQDEDYPQEIVSEEEEQEEEKQELIEYNQKIYNSDEEQNEDEEYQQQNQLSNSEEEDDDVDDDDKLAISQKNQSKKQKNRTQQPQPIKKKKTLKFAKYQTLAINITLKNNQNPLQIQLKLKQ